MAPKKQIEPVEVPFEPEDTSAAFVPEHHKPADDSEITCTAAIRAALGAEGYQYWLHGELIRRAWISARDLSELNEADSGAGSLKKLSWFAAKLTEEVER